VVVVDTVVVVETIVVVDGAVVVPTVVAVVIEVAVVVVRQRCGLQREDAGEATNIAVAKPATTKHALPRSVCRRRRTSP
jgi:hypothetical protein